MIHWFVHSMKGCLKELICRILDSPFIFQPPFTGMKPRGLNRFFGADIAPDCILGRGIRAINWRNIRMDSGVIMAEDIKFLSHAPIIIGQWSMIGSETMLISGGHRKTDLAPTSSSIELGKGVFVGARVLILEGVKIGDHAMIGAGAVVTRSIPPLAIAVGSPARVIAYRKKPNRIWTMPGMVDIDPEDLWSTPQDAFRPEVLCHETD